jgi:hypothetical protein
VFTAQFRFNALSIGNCSFSSLAAVMARGFNTHNVVIAGRSVATPQHLERVVYHDSPRAGAATIYAEEEFHS